MKIMETFKLILAFILMGAIAFVVIAGLWWVVLWSFGFPILFAWKQVIGVVTIAAIMNLGSANK